MAGIKGPRSPAALAAAKARSEREAARRKVFSNLLRAAMAKKAMSQSELAETASRFLPPARKTKGKRARGQKIGRDSISSYCSGKGYPTAPGYLDAIAQALDTTVEALTPRAEQTAAGTEPFPALQIEAASEGGVWLRVNQLVSMDTALKVARLIEEDKDRKNSSEPTLIQFGAQR